MALLEVFCQSFLSSSDGRGKSEVAVVEAVKIAVVKLAVDVVLACCVRSRIFRAAFRQMSSISSTRIWPENKEKLVWAAAGLESHSHHQMETPSGNLELNRPKLAGASQWLKLENYLQTGKLL